MPKARCSPEKLVSYFRRMPKNIRSLEVSSGGFSAACVVALTARESEVEDGAVEAGDTSYEEPEDADAIV
jgi:hypothetical protein